MRNRRMLTKREFEILRLLAAGYDHRSIACRLIVSPRTVQVHVSHIMKKLVAINAQHAVTIALRRNLLSLEQVPEIAVLCD